MSPRPSDAFFTRGRIIRWTVLLLLGVLGFLVCWHDPVYGASSSSAGRVTVTLHTDGHGAVWLRAAHPDGTPVTGAIDATLSARSGAGTSLTAIPLTDLRDGSARYAGTLDAGVWTVTVDFATPAAGTCTGVLTADAAATPDSIACALAAAAVPLRLADTVPPAAGRASLTALLIAAGVVALLFTAVTLVTLRRR